MSTIKELTNTVETANFLDIATNAVYDVYLAIRYSWYFNVLGYSKDKYLSDVADPVYDGLRDKGFLDKINNKVNGVETGDKVAGDTYLDMLNSYNPITNGNYNFVPQQLGGVLATGNSTNTAELLTGEQGMNASNSEVTGSYILDAAGKLGLDNTRDSDGDSIPDIIDASPRDANNMTSAELNTLFESEYGIVDKVRMAFGMGPKDIDGDGLPDVYEDKIGTSPLSSDTDIDGMSDLQEIIAGTDPLNADTDGDGVMDGRDQDSLNKFVTTYAGVADTDGDGVADIIEKYLGGNINSKDTDNDGTPDGMDIIINGDNDKVVNYTTGYNRTLLNFDSAGWLHNHLRIENGILSFATDIVSMLFIFALIFFVSSFSKWWFAMKKAAAHYEHTFNPHDSHGHTIHEVDHLDHNAHAIGPDGYGDPEGLPTEWYPEDHNISHDIANAESTSINDVLASETEHILHPYRDKWQIVENYMTDELEVMWRLGIIEADNLLYQVLSDKGYSGETLGDMLKSANFHSIDQAWDAHKVRNRIAHEGSAYNLTDREARRVFAIYEEVLKELKAI